MEYPPHASNTDHRQGPYRRGVEWPMMMMAITASVILALGLIPPYFELAKRNGRVIGISSTHGLRYTVKLADRCRFHLPYGGLGGRFLLLYGFR